MKKRDADLIKKQIEQREAAELAREEKLRERDRKI